MTTPRTPRRAAIDRPSLADRVYDAMLRQILLGEYDPGERLNVDLLAEHFGVSRTPIREALTQLQSDRFVDIFSNSRTLVAAWDEADMAERVRLLARIVDLLTLEDARPLTISEQDSQCLASVFVRICEPIVADARDRVAGQMAERCLTQVTLFIELRHQDSCDCTPSLVPDSTIVELGERVATMLTSASCERIQASR